MQSLKDSTRPDRGPLLAYLKTSVAVSKKDAQGVVRWLAGLRLADTEVHLTCADNVVAWAASVFAFLLI